MPRRRSYFPPATTVLIVYIVSALAAKAQTTNAGAATENSPQLSLTQVRQTAFERNWDLLAAKSGVDLATAQGLAAREFPNPTASLSATQIGSHEASTVLGNGIWERNYDSTAAVSQLIEIGGKRRDRRNSSQAGVTGARARFFDAKRTLDQGITKAYVAAALASHNVEILNQSAGYLLREAEIAEARFKAGDISDSDKKQIEIDAERFELQAKAAETAAVQARIAVEVLMGIGQPLGKWQPAEPLNQLADNAFATPAASGTNAARPDVLAAEADLKKSEADLRLQKAVRVPDPTFQVQGEHYPQGDGFPVDTVGFGVSFPLPLWNRNTGNIKAAEATRAQASIALEKAKAQAVSDISNADVAYHEAFERWRRYRDQTGPKATKVRQTVAFAYEKGGASLVDLLEAERTDNEVRLATAQAMADTANAAADLAAARNALTESELNAQK